MKSIQLFYLYFPWPLLRQTSKTLSQGSIRFFCTSYFNHRALIPCVNQFRELFFFRIFFPAIYPVPSFFLSDILCRLLSCQISSTGSALPELEFDRREQDILFPHNNLVPFYLERRLPFGSHILSIYNLAKYGHMGISKKSDIWAKRLL